MKKVKADPHREAIVSRIAARTLDLERSFSRMKRWFNRMDKLRQQLVRLHAQLRRLDEGGAK